MSMGFRRIAAVAAFFALVCGMELLLPFAGPAGRCTLCGQEPDAGPRLVVSVNGRQITEGDLEFLYLVRRVRDELKPAVRERYIEQLIDRVLLEQFLKERGVSVSEKLVAERIHRIESLVKREGLDFDEVLENIGFSRETFRQEVELPLAWRRHASLAITDTAIQSWWDAHRSEYDGTECRAAHIVKRLPRDADEAAVSKLTSELAGLRDQIIAGQVSFKDAAASHSDSPSARDGGDLGQFAWHGRMPLEISEQAFVLKPGEVSQPFQTRFGLHLLTVTEVIPGDLSLEDARPEIFQTLSEKLQAELIARLRMSATITWADGRS